MKVITEINKNLFESLVSSAYSAIADHTETGSYEQIRGKAEKVVRTILAELKQSGVQK